MGNFEESKINWEIKCKSVHPDDELLFMKKKTGCLLHTANISNVIKQYF